MSPLHRKLRRFHAALAEARRAGGPADELIDRREDAWRQSLARSQERSAAPAIGRRGVLSGAAALAASALLPRPVASATAPRIVVVGAGLAGLTAAYRIHQLTGWVPQLYEAQDRVGGRVRTIRSLTAGQYTEAGASGINSNDEVLHDLCAELGLTPLVDTFLDDPGGSEVYRFDGRSYTWNQLRPGLREIADAAWRAWVRIGRRVPTYRHNNASARRYDGMSVTEFLAAETAHGPATPAGAYIVNQFGVEYGGRASEASALHLILEEGNIWGGGVYDERYAVPDGNDRLPGALAERLPADALSLGHALTAIRRNGNGSYTLTFQRDSALVDVIADRVVLAIPPTMLRNVDTAKAKFGAGKENAFSQEGMGSNAKLNLQFSGRPWAANKRSGDAVTDLATAVTWQASYLATDPAVLIAMNNNDYGDASAHGTMPAELLAPTLQAVDTIFPGASSSLIDGQAYLDNWPNDPWVRGSYAYNPVGGFTAYQGIQAEPRGNVSFAGEHTARYIRKGTMAGAVESGERAAREVTAG